MGCGCSKKRESFKVQLPGGLTVTKGTEAEATRFAAKHPGAKVVKASAA